MNLIINEDNIIKSAGYGIVFIMMVYLSEIGGYFWHKWGAHTDIIPPVRQTHLIHHLADLSHEAHEDFFWIIILLIIPGIFLYYLYY